MSRTLYDMFLLLFIIFNTYYKVKVRCANRIDDFETSDKIMKEDLQKLECHNSKDIYVKMKEDVFQFKVELDNIGPESQNIPQQLISIQTLADRIISQFRAFLKIHLRYLLKVYSEINDNAQLINIEEIFNEQQNPGHHGISETDDEGNYDQQDSRYNSDVLLQTQEADQTNMKMDLLSQYLENLNQCTTELPKIKRYDNFLQPDDMITPDLNPVFTDFKQFLEALIEKRSHLTKHSQPHIDLLSHVTKYIIPQKPYWDIPESDQKRRVQHISGLLDLIITYTYNIFEIESERKGVTSNEPSDFPYSFNPPVNHRS